MKMLKYFDMSCNANIVNRYCVIIMLDVIIGEFNKVIDQYIFFIRRNIGGRWGDDRLWKFVVIENIRDYW